jgi:ketosteroid isomerase-like protein
MTSMTEEAAPVNVARAFTEAWTSGDMDTATGYVADDVVFDGPLGHVEGKTAYTESLKGLSRNLAVTGARVVAAFGDATQALIMYELLTDRFGALTCAKLLTVRDGKIQTDRLTFDSYPVRKS